MKNEAKRRIELSEIHLIHARVLLSTLEDIMLSGSGDGSVRLIDKVEAITHGA